MLHEPDCIGGNPHSAFTEIAVANGFEQTPVSQVFEVRLGNVVPRVMTPVATSQAFRASPILQLVAASWRTWAKPAANSLTRQVLIRFPLKLGSAPWEVVILSSKGISKSAPSFCLRVFTLSALSPSLTTARCRKSPSGFFVAFWISSTSLYYGDEFRVCFLSLELLSPARFVQRLIRKPAIRPLFALSPSQNRFFLGDTDGTTHKLILTYKSVKAQT